MLSLVDAAEGMLGEIETPDRPLVLLHGDLNHWNTLRAGDGWKAIDPKGAVGVRCLEAGRYIINELDLLSPAKRQPGLDGMTSTIGAEMGEPPHAIAACAFYDSVLSTCWSFEEHERRDLSAQVDRCAFLLRDTGASAAGRSLHRKKGSEGVHLDMAPGHRPRCGPSPSLCRSEAHAELHQITKRHVSEYCVHFQHNVQYEVRWDAHYALCFEGDGGT